MLSLLEQNETSPGLCQLAQLFVVEPVVAVYGQPFVLREESPPATLGGGRVVQPWSRRMRRRDQTAIARLDGLRSADHVVRLRAALAFLGPTSWTERPLCALAGLAVDQVESALASLMASGALIEIPIGPRRTVRVLAESVAELEERAMRALGRLHEAHPRQSAIPRAQLVSVFPELANEAFVNGLIDRLKARGMVVADPRGRSGWLRAQAEPGGNENSRTSWPSRSGPEG